MPCERREGSSAATAWPTAARNAGCAGRSAPNTAVRARNPSVSRGAASAPRPASAAIAAKAFAGDVAPLHEAMGGAMSIEEIRAQEADMMRDRESRLGKFKTSAVVGALPRDAETLRVFEVSSGGDVELATSRLDEGGDSIRIVGLPTGLDAWD